MAVFLLCTLIVCLYLVRLESHTPADVFLPTDYHAMVESDSQEGGALDAYYQGYAAQPGRPYTIRQDLLLARLAYINAPQGFRGETTGVTLQALCHEVNRTLNDESLDAASIYGRSRQELLGITAGIGESGLLGALVIREYITTPSGLTGYVLEKDGELTMALRGTDDTTDMLDNLFLLPFNVSVQYRDIRRLLVKYGDTERIWLTGHSKGGHNAIYAASIDARCSATAFNAPGFGIFLSNRQHDGLGAGVNYVINGDITGFLLFHMERHVILESMDAAVSLALTSGNRHLLDNFFVLDDLTVATRIQPLSVASEWVTQIVWLLLLFAVVYFIFWLFWKLGWGVAWHVRRVARRPAPQNG